VTAVVAAVLIAALGIVASQIAGVAAGGLIALAFYFLLAKIRRVEAEGFLSPRPISGSSTGLAPRGRAALITGSTSMPLWATPSPTRSQLIDQCAR
jgi:hypothetical protein